MSIFKAEPRQHSVGERHCDKPTTHLVEGNLGTIQIERLDRDSFKIIFPEGKMAQEVNNVRVGDIISIPLTIRWI